MPEALVVGRDGELATIAEAIDAARDGRPAVVWVEGQAGSGKSTLVERAVAMFRASGPEGAERIVWHVAGDAEEQLIEHGIADRLVELARGPGRLLEPSSPPHERALAVLAAMRALSPRGALLLVVDDLHWCDHSSRQMLRFLVRRLDGLRVLVLLAHRPMGSWPEDVRHAAPDGGEVIALRGLSVAAVREFAAAGGVPLTPRAGRRLHAHTGGNPQLLHALVSELPPEELSAGEGPLPAPCSFAEWVHDAFATAPPAVRSVVAAVTVLAAPASLALVAEMTGLADPGRAVDEAVSRRLLRRVAGHPGRRVDVEHALVRSAVSKALGFAEASILHTRAAALTQDPLRAMLHRLQACDAFDVALADGAVELADECAADGALLASARLLVHAGGVMPPGPRRREVWVTAAERLLVIGELRWAERLLADVAAQRHRDPTDHELLVRGHLALQQRLPEEARLAANRAWELGRDPRVVAGAAELLAYLGMDAGDGEAATTWATRAIEAADTRLVGLQWSGTVLASGWALRGDLHRAREVLEVHGRRLAGTASEPDLRLGLALTQLWTGDFAAAADTLAQLRGLVADGPAVLRSTVQLAAAELDFRRGRWDDVLVTTDSELALVDEGWESRTAPMTLAVGAFVCAARGWTSRALDVVARAEGLLEAEANVPARIMTAVARGRIALAAGDSAGVVVALEPLLHDPRVADIPEGVHAWRADLAEAYVAEGRAAEATPLLADTVHSDEDPHARAGMLRARAAWAAARHRPDEAQALLEEAAAIGADRCGPFLHARAELALGAWLRRRGRRRLAADRLASALAGFTSLAATPFADAARQELELCALRRSPVAGALTPAEEAVARLAVDGLTNREIAQALTVSIKTVETHLGRVFAKLNVRHRVELVGALGERDA